jgi:polyhydroxyalkanoate synthesis repressor PhaR
MSEKTTKEPTTIKKYANRRLYHTGTSSYVTLEDLALMVRQGEDFVVVDAKSGEDITRTVLTQIIFEQESKGQNLLPSPFLRQLIQFYGDNMQSLVPNYLEFSLDRFMAEQQKLREQFAKGFAPGTFPTGNFPANPFGTNMIGAMQEQAQANMALFQEAMKAFAAFGSLPVAGDPKKKS